MYLSRLRGSDGLDRTLLLVLAALFGASVALSGIFGFHIHFISPGVDLIVDTATTVVTLSVAALAWARFGETREAIAIFQASSFLVAATANGFSLLLVLDQIDRIPGAALLAPGQAALYVSTTARILSAALLVVGGLAAARRGGARRPQIALAIPPLLLVALVVVYHYLEPDLPPLSTSFGAPGVGAVSALPDSTPFGTSIQTIGGVLFLGGALVARRLHRRDGRVVDAYLAVGLVFGAFSQFHLALYPGTYPGLVTSGDLLRLAFDLVLLLGIEAEARSTLVDLRQANRTLERLRDVEAAQAALEERARLSRELHDGLAQDLWLAKLKVGRLVGLPTLDAGAQALSAELASAIDAGLAEARWAVQALRPAGEPLDAPFLDQLRRVADDFADRFGLPAEIECIGELPKLAPREEVELLRIVQEALNNVRRHADATMVKVQASVADGQLELSVRDNGRGFDTASIKEGSFGLTGMRERAALIGGRLTIDSRPADGTRIRVDLALSGLGTPEKVITA